MRPSLLAPAVSRSFALGVQLVMADMGRISDEQSLAAGGGQMDGPVIAEDDLRTISEASRRDWRER